MDHHPPRSLANSHVAEPLPYGLASVQYNARALPDERLGNWIERLSSQDWGEAYKFFKHEEAGTGPKLAGRFLELAGL